MTFKDVYKLENDSIYVCRGKFRDQFWWDHFFSSTPDTVKMVYDMMEMAYNSGEHNGRRYVRRAVKEALDIEL